MRIDMVGTAVVVAVDVILRLGLAQLGMVILVWVLHRHSRFHGWCSWCRLASSHRTVKNQSRSLCRSIVVSGGSISRIGEFQAWCTEKTDLQQSLPQRKPRMATGIRRMVGFARAALATEEQRHNRRKLSLTHLNAPLLTADTPQSRFPM